MSETCLQGWFLIAANHLKDANFHRTVVLMLQHTSDGSMGLVINRPSSMTITGVLSQHGAVRCDDAPVYTGGPVETSSLFIVHNDARLSSSDQEIAPGVFLAGSEQSFESLIRTTPEPGRHIKLRLLCGYAGWGGGQLEGELERGDWYTMPADGQLVLDEDPYDLWEVCVRRLKHSARLIDQDVTNPEWN